MAAPISDLHRALGGVRRAADARWLNEIANDPAVLPSVIGLMDPPLDLTDVAADPRNICLTGEHGAIVFHHRMPGLYDAHTMALERGRGKWCQSFVRAALHWLFTRTDAVEVVSRCPRGNVAAKALAKSVGLTYEFTNRRGWAMNGEIVPADIYALTVQHWMRDAPGLVERGRWFHERLEAEGAGPQPEDMAIDRYVGAAVEMILNGQPDKGVVFFNRFGILSDRAPAQVLVHEPLAVEMADAVLIVRDADFYVASVTADAA